MVIYPLSPVLLSNQLLKNIKGQISANCENIKKMKARLKQWLPKLWHIFSRDPAIANWLSIVTGRETHWIYCLVTWQRNIYHVHTHWKSTICIAMFVSGGPYSAIFQAFQQHSNRNLTISAVQESSATLVLDAFQQAIPTLTQERCTIISKIQGKIHQSTIEGSQHCRLTALMAIFFGELSWIGTWLPSSIPWLPDTGLDTAAPLGLTPPLVSREGAMHTETSRFGFLAMLHV